MCIWEGARGKVLESGALEKTLIDQLSITFKVANSHVLLPVEAAGNSTRPPIGAGGCRLICLTTHVARRNALR